jgi:hypothetical protein
MTQFPRLLQVLAEASVELIVVGGVAATAHGAARTTLDLDVVYRRSPENLAHLVTALGPYSPYPRGAPRGLPFQWDIRTLENGLNFTLTTSLGEIDLLGEITAGGAYDDLLSHSTLVELFGAKHRIIDLGELIRVKRAVGRPKDFEAIAELELLWQHRKG